tara:strand:+ start:112 stop:396 length:285 start_codon:yes stop_codon:yes gene_type:complete
MKKSILVTLFYLLTVLLFTGCADVSPNIETCVTSDPYGFWSGLWHGMITPFSWVGSLFSNEIAIYAYDNNGGWYDFGFILGIGGLSLSSGRASK